MRIKLNIFRILITTLLFVVCISPNVNSSTYCSQYNTQQACQSSGNEICFWSMNACRGCDYFTTQSTCSSTYNDNGTTRQRCKWTTANKTTGCYTSDYSCAQLRMNSTSCKNAGCIPVFNSSGVQAIGCNAADNPPDCPSGTYKANQNECITCPINYYCTDNTANDCSAATNDLYPSSDGGTSSVDQCYRTVPAGKEFDSDNNNVVSCHCGYYCEGGKMTYGNAKKNWGRTGDCGAGNYCPSGSSAPITCPKGYKCPTTTECNKTACLSGTYQDKEGQTTCKNCTNKPNGATYKADETAVSKTNDCSWYLPKCSGNQKYNESTKACENCSTGHHGELDWNLTGFTGICHRSDLENNYLCKSDYTFLQSNVHTYEQAKTCEPNVYTVNVYAEYKKDGETKIVDTGKTFTYTYNSGSTVLTATSNTTIPSELGTSLNNGTGKYYYNTDEDSPYIKVGNQTAALKKDSGNWVFTSATERSKVASLTHNTTINMYLKIQSNPYKVYIATSAMAPGTASPSDKFDIYTTQIATKHFGDTPATGVAPGDKKDEVKTCKYETLSNGIKVETYGYIHNDTQPKYYECNGTTNPVNLVTNTNNGSTAMFEPSKNDNNICVAYTMTTCDAGYKCSSCSSRSVCDNGTHQPNTGQSSCSNCAAGTFTPDDNQAHASCSSCTAGTYQPDTGKSSCSNCPAGQYQDQKGQASCKDCSAGSATGTTATGATSCSQCDPGTYSDKATNTSCSTCPAGKYSNEGATKCESCGAGTYSGAGASGCEPCPAGTYQPQSEQPHCISCQDGNTHRTEATTGLFKSDSTTGQTSRDLCYINPDIKLTDKFNTEGIAIPNSSSNKIFWRGDNSSNSN